MSKILIIDDDPDICALLSRYLSKKGFETSTAGTANAGIQKLEKGKFDLVVCDFKLPDTDGLELIKKIKVLRPGTQIILITGYADIRVAVKALKLGAYDYVTKPLYQDELLLTIKNALEQEETTNKRNTPRKSKPKTFVEGKSRQAELVQKHIELIAPTNMTVIIAGETGTGKEYTARRIHAKSKRNKQPFVAVDCGALPKDIAGSTLFGHVKGAFTGALDNKKGCFEQAKSGTLFLDEIGNLSYENQVKLLRVIQERIVQPVGSEESIPVDVRLLVATNDDLKDAISAGNFREDLFHRLNEFQIHLSPLRERKEDVEIYVKHFLQEAIESLEKDDVQIGPKAMGEMKNYSWPGNLREVRNTIKRLVLLNQNGVIQASDLPVEIQYPENPNQAQIKPAENSYPEPLKAITARAEKTAIIHALKFANNNKSMAAKLLEVDRKTLYNKMAEYDIN